MKVIAAEFIKGGFTHKVLERRGMVLLVQRQHRTESGPHWEVVRITQNPERLLYGRMIEAHEAFPPAEAWGTHGWTYTTLEDARAKFDLLTTKPT